MTASGNSLSEQIAELLSLARSGAGAIALRRLDELAYRQGLSDEYCSAVKAEIIQIMAQVLQRVDRPCDHWMLRAVAAKGAALPRNSRLPGHSQSLPRGFPFGMALPLRQQLTDILTAPPVEVDRSLPPDWPQALGRVAIVLSSQDLSADLPMLQRLIERQSDGLTVKIAVFCQGAEHHQNEFVEVFPISICDERAQPSLAQLALRAEQLLFVEGGTVLDPTAFERLCRRAATSARLVQPLIAPGGDATFQPYSLDRVIADFPANLPFRGVQGLNLMVSSQLWAEVGGISPRFRSSQVAAVELGYRLFVAGAWFIPQQVPRLGRGSKAAVSEQDLQLYRSLCPNRVDRPSGSGFEVPKISIYIPAWNASRFLVEAVHSALNQDYRDLDVCIHDDGSYDGTLDLLEREFSNEPRVKWQTAPNRGIGAASNAAIAMSRSLYIGQLDADDRLLPGAVSRLVERLEADPRLACVYASCERIDAQGRVIKPEYDWPVYSHEKLLLTSIVHHFRVFRRQAFSRTDGFRTDIRNAVDYDLFLKLAEVGRLEHLQEVLYQRRWHDTNTSHRYEAEQSRNTHVVQRAALERMGLSRHWRLDIPDPDQPRQVTYRRHAQQPMVFYWPDYSRENPYQRLLYRNFERAGAEVSAASPEAALRAIRDGSVDPSLLTFHLHWLHFLFPETVDLASAKQAARRLLQVLSELKKAGVRLVWTMHNLVAHESRYPALELALARALLGLVDRVHLHSSAAAQAVAQYLPLPTDKLVVARHGHYIEAYPDHVSKAQARALLGLDPAAKVVVFVGAVRRYKGVEDLIEAFRILLPRRPDARLVISGSENHDPFTALSAALHPHESAAMLRLARHLDPAELQLVFRAADVAAFPFQRVLTSGSVILALGFGCPVVLPEHIAPAQALHRLPFVGTYPSAKGPAALADALETMLAVDEGERFAREQGAFAYARAQDWPEPDDLDLLRSNSDLSDHT
jgi:glycosyltransferase involved in cell wall biosynthesis